MLPGPVRRRPVDDRLDRRQEILPERAEEGVAPDLTLLRDQEPERRKPVLIDEMLERHRRGVDDMVDVVHRFGRRRIDAERMELRPILAGFDDRALHERGREAPLVRNRLDSWVVVSTVTGIPAPEAAMAPRSRRRRDFHGMRTVLRQKACSDRLTRTSLSFSTLSREAELCRLSSKLMVLSRDRARPARAKRRPMPQCARSDKRGRRGQAPEAYPPRTRRLAATSSASAASA